ncbi:hypothetical protein [Mangrovicoccus algicola]|uniref:Uncharacterized protein n=1 Tax=Mangrovicoccus algicola TaxID=2771008 RepID=A0A8J6YQ32_9RHOB|nr:hypothetical protein [Mangrovicoccus algicola]MBE3637428.1 hypothetical protein [Mangrovicoccus algicola]
MATPQRRDPEAAGISGCKPDRQQGPTAQLPRNRLIVFQIRKEVVPQKGIECPYI